MTDMLRLYSLHLLFKYSSQPTSSIHTYDLMTFTMATVEGTIIMMY